MKFDGTEIRSSMDNRLSALDADPARRVRIRQRIYEAEEPVMKKKWTASLAFGIALTLVLMGTALAVGINLFEYFGKDDMRLAEIAPQAELMEIAALNVESEELGETNIAISNAYYDGQSLLVGYTIENDCWIERFEPTDEQLAGMEKMESMFFPINDRTQPILDAYYEAVEKGEPFGFVEYEIYPSDTWETVDGIELPTTVQTEDITMDGRLVLKEFESPLPEQAQNLDSINIQANIWRSVNYNWFDGENLYSSAERRREGVLTAEVPRTEAQTLHYAGEGSCDLQTLPYTSGDGYRAQTLPYVNEDGEYNCVPVHASAEVSSVAATLTITAEDGPIPEFGDRDIWHDVYVLDENGRKLWTRQIGVISGEIQARLSGTGRQPEQLIVYVFVCQEGEWEPEEWIKTMEPIVLTVQD